MADDDIKALEERINALKGELALRTDSAKELFNSKNEAMDKRLSSHIKVFNIVFIALAGVIAIITIFLTVFSVDYIKKKANFHAERSAQEAVKTLVNKHEKTLEARLSTMENRIESYFWYQKGELELKNIDYNSAITFFRNALNKTEDSTLSAYSHHGIGIAYYRLGSYDNAFNSYEDAIAYKEDYAHAHHNRGVIYKLKELYDNAIEDFNVAAKLFINERNYKKAHVSIERLKQVTGLLNDKDVSIKDKAERFIREREEQLKEAKKGTKKLQNEN